MFNFFRNLFVKKYPLGALRNPIDSRNINAAAFQPPIALPRQYMTKMPGVKYQSGSECVAYSISEVMELYFMRKGVTVELSPLDLYAQAKKIDGIPDQPGTYPFVGAKIAVNSGVASQNTYDEYKNDEKTLATSRAKYKVGGYAFVSPTYNAVCQAIYQNGVCMASFDVDINWYLGIIGKVLKTLGRHYVVLHGYDRDTDTLYGQNSWGVGWMGNLAGFLNPKVAPGHFEMLWDDVKDNILDIMILADVPKELIDAAKGLPYQFSTTMKFGSVGYEVKKLQEYLKVGADGNFGGRTKQAVIALQQKNGLVADGIVGANTRAILNKS